jgi:hypothetical protein
MKSERNDNLATEAVEDLPVIEQQPKKRKALGHQTAGCTWQPTQVCMSANRSESNNVVTIYRKS